MYSIQYLDCSQQTKKQLLQFKDPNMTIAIEYARASVLYKG